MHIFLTARAFSASGVIYSGDKDRDLEKRIKYVESRWGGPFKVRYEKNWKKVIENWNKTGVTCHLTMYGKAIDISLNKIPKNKEVLVIVGSKKVPRSVFQMVNFNIAIGNQPHSEVAALAVFLYSHFGKEAIKTEFEEAKMRIIPQDENKKVVEF
jgi:tRNA (cytidine56-2'-O)-methyltransferase